MKPTTELEIIKEAKQMGTRLISAHHYTTEKSNLFLYLQ